MQSSKFKQNRLLFLTGVTGFGAFTLAPSAHAQSTTIDTTTVNTQLTAVQSGITGVGGVLLAMAMGMLLFGIGSNIIKRVTKR